MNTTIAVLSSGQSQVNLSPEDRKRALTAAFWLTASPHEWNWSVQDQVAMAMYVLWATQRLDAIRELSDGRLHFKHETKARGE